MKTILPALLASAACGGRASPICTADPAPSESAVLIDLTIDARAGQEPFAMGKMLTSAAGNQFSVSTLRFYLSHLQLVTDRGTIAPAVLAEEKQDLVAFLRSLTDDTLATDTKFLP